MDRITTAHNIINSTHFFWFDCILCLTCKLYYHLISAFTDNLIICYFVLYIFKVDVLLLQSPR